MKLLHVIAGAAIGGAETFAQDAILALHARGVAQTVLTRPWPAVMARYQAAGVDARPFSFTRLDRLKLAPRRIRTLATELGVDLVQAWMQRAGSFVPSAMPCPVIGWFGDYYNLKYFPNADCCVAVTPDISRYIVAEGRPVDRVFTVNTFGTMPAAAPVSRASLTTPDDVPLLLVLSRMHRVKGIDTMLHALAETPGVWLWLAGDGPEKAAYEALARQLGVAERVRFLGWRNDRRALIEACDVVVLPSRYEPFGTVIAEAWAMDRPLVATRADGARQYVVDGQSGLLCPIDDAASLAACLRRVVADPDLRTRLVAGGAAAYQADFTRDVVTDRLLACYTHCIELGKCP
ncbi:MAG: glycosyltransferase [Acetobacteraceae bacterium]|nr:glycosyltransferase [Acetobacteraceae bacterium]